MRARAVLLTLIGSACMYEDTGDRTRCEDVTIWGGTKLAAPLVGVAAGRRVVAWVEGDAFPSATVRIVAREGRKIVGSHSIPWDARYRVDCIASHPDGHLLVAGEFELLSSNEYETTYEYRITVLPLDSTGAPIGDWRLIRKTTVDASTPLVDAVFDGTNVILSWQEADDAKMVSVSTNGEIVSPGIVTLGTSPLFSRRTAVAADAAGLSWIAWLSDDHQVLGVRVRDGVVIDSPPRTLAAGSERTWDLSLAASGGGFMLAVGETDVDLPSTSYVAVSLAADGTVGTAVTLPPREGMGSVRLFGTAAGYLAVKGIFDLRFGYDFPREATASITPLSPTGIIGKATSFPCHDLSGVVDDELLVASVRDVATGQEGTRTIELHTFDGSALSPAAVVASSSILAHAETVCVEQ